MWRNRGLLGPPTGRSFRPLGAQHTAAYSGAGQGQRVGQRKAETIGRRREAEGRGGARWGQLRLLPGFRPRRLGQSRAPLSRRQHLPLPRTTRCGPRRSEAWPTSVAGALLSGMGVEPKEKPERDGDPPARPLPEAASRDRWSPAKELAGLRATALRGTLEHPPVRPRAAPLRTPSLPARAGWARTRRAYAESGNRLPSTVLQDLGWSD